MTKTDIRKAQLDDLPAMQDIARRTIDQCYRSFLTDEGVDGFINSGESDRELERHLGNCDVMLVDEKVVAFAVCFDDFIHLMMVDVRLHGTGLGSQLLAHAESSLFADGRTRIRLETFDGNQQAIRFYSKNGWVRAGERLDEDHGFIRVLMEKSA